MLLARYRHVKRTSRYAGKESDLGLEFPPRPDTFNRSSVSCWCTNLHTRRLGPRVRSFLSTEILQVRLRTQNETHFMSRHPEWRGRVELDPR
jgi:hypothetical protein